MRKINKVLRIGTLPTHGGGRVSTYIRIRNDDGYMSFTGVIGPTQSGNAYGSCGQISMGFAHRDPTKNDSRYSKPTPASDFNFAPGWSAGLWLDLLEKWDTWHMSKAAPDSVIEWIESLPETDREPAWA